MLETDTLTRPVPPSSREDDDDLDVFNHKNPASNQYVIAADAPVLPSLASRGQAQLVVNEAGSAMVLFDVTLPDAVHWVEYDMDIDSLTFVTWKGAIFSLGMKIHKPFRKYLSKRHEIYLVEMKDAQVPIMMDVVPMVVRRIGI